MTKKPILPLVERLPKKTSHRLVVENPEKQARQNAQWQEEVAKQVSDRHLSFYGLLTNQREVEKGTENVALTDLNKFQGSSVTADN